jgi:hypothetical protein
MVLDERRSGARAVWLAALVPLAKQEERPSPAAGATRSSVALAWTGALVITLLAPRGQPPPARQPRKPRRRRRVRVLTFTVN